MYESKGSLRTNTEVITWNIWTKPLGKKYEDNYTTKTCIHTIKTSKWEFSLTWKLQNVDCSKVTKLMSKTLFWIDNFKLFRIKTVNTVVKVVFILEVKLLIWYLVLMRYWARLIASGVPEIATVLSLDPSSELEILMVAPESCLLA